MDSQAAFIDHRNAPLSVSRPRALTIGSHGRSGLSQTRPDVLRDGRGSPEWTGDVDEDAIADGEGSRRARDAPPLRRMDTGGSGRSRRSERSDHRRSHNDRDHSLDPRTPELSRRPSDAEADVCFPQHLDAAALEAAAADALPNHQHADDRHHARHGVPGVLPHFPFPFDFTALEEFAERERESAGISIKPKLQKANGDAAITFSPPDNDGPRRRHPVDHKTNPRPEEGEANRRKLSESTAGGRSGRYQRKLALFEGGGNGSATAKTPLLAPEGKSSARRGSFGALDNARSASEGAAGEKDRPYRFSFYSNALTSTIHARAMSEIPADGQTFEELFVGPNGENSGSPDRDDTTELPSESASAMNISAAVKTGAMLLPAGMPSGARVSHAAHAVRSIEDAEANTWWLDVLNPTDAEMKALGKCFGIHPLTSEDIQMEETREKIELFRNYYLVCFRSFDQDPYSPTYLEPLNMYVIVFREGTLSVRRYSAGLVADLSVPLLGHAAPAERPSPHQAAQGLHQRHVRLDLVRPDRRHHRRVRPAHSEHRVRGRLGAWLMLRAC